MITFNHVAVMNADVNFQKCGLARFTDQTTVLQTSERVAATPARASTTPAATDIANSAAFFFACTRDGKDRCDGASDSTPAILVRKLITAEAVSQVKQPGLSHV